MQGIFPNHSQLNNSIEISIVSHMGEDPVSIGQFAFIATVIQLLQAAGQVRIGFFFHQVGGHFCDCSYHDLEARDRVVNHPQVS